MGTMRRVRPPHLHDSTLISELHLLNVAITNFDLAVRAELGVGARGYLAIQYLVAAGSDVGLKELGDLLGVGSSACTLLVNRLERAGHLRRTPHPQDARRTNVTVSDATRGVIVAAKDAVGEAVDEVVQNLESRDRVVIERFLDLVARSYDDVTSARQRQSRIEG